MSEYIKVQFVDRLNRALAAWKQMRPTKKFGGLTVDEFEIEVHKAGEARDQLVTAEKVYQQYRESRDLAEKNARLILQCVVDSIKGDPQEGKSGNLYKACGYITPDERRRAPRGKRRVTGVHDKQPEGQIPNTEATAAPQAMQTTHAIVAA